jgi:hypothetical protein
VIEEGNQPVRCGALKKHLPAQPGFQMVDCSFRYLGRKAPASEKEAESIFRREVFDHKIRIPKKWLTATPSGKVAVLVENRNVGACGSAGCSLPLFAEEATRSGRSLCDGA